MQLANVSLWESLIFTRDEVRVCTRVDEMIERLLIQVACQGSPSCEFDYILTGRREIALDTLDTEKKLEGSKRDGEMMCTCVLINNV